MFRTVILTCILWACVMVDLSFLSQPLTSRPAAETFIRRLNESGLMFHFEDDVHDIMWIGVEPTFEQLVDLNCRRNELYTFEWNEFECPIGYALHVMEH